jgi:hypothetical protein
MCLFSSSLLLFIYRIFLESTSLSLDRVASRPRSTSLLSRLLSTPVQTGNTPNKGVWVVGEGAGCYITILGQVNFEDFSVILKAEGCHGEYNILPIHRLPLLLMTLLRSYPPSAPLHAPTGKVIGGWLPSEVMKAMNSVTHSWTHSFASFAIFALSGSAFFMMREMLAIGRSAIFSLSPSSCDSTVLNGVVVVGRWAEEWVLMRCVGGVAAPRIGF